MTAGTPYCEPCQSFHPAPTSREHWRELRCFAPCPFPRQSPTPEERADDICHDAFVSPRALYGPDGVRRLIANAIRDAVADALAAETDRSDVAHAPPRGTLSASTVARHSRDHTMASPKNGAGKKTLTEAAAKGGKAGAAKGGKAAAKGKGGK